MRASAVESALLGSSDLAAAAAHAAEGTDPPEDTFGTADYRRHLASVIVRRALDNVLGPLRPAPPSGGLGNAWPAGAKFAYDR